MQYRDEAEEQRPTRPGSRSVTIAVAVVPLPRRYLFHGSRARWNGDHSLRAPNLVANQPLRDECVIAGSDARQLETPGRVRLAVRSRVAVRIDECHPGIGDRTIAVAGAADHRGGERNSSRLGCFLAQDNDRFPTRVADVARAINRPDQQTMVSGRQVRERHFGCPDPG